MGIKEHNVEAARGLTADGSDHELVEGNVRDEIDPSLGIEFDDRHDADAEHTHADVSKARETIGYEPTTTVQEGTRRFIDRYRDNKGWYDPLVRRS